MRPEPQTATVELGRGGRGRRWWPVAVVALAAWIAAAVAAGSGGGDDEPAAPTTASPVTTATTRAPRPSTTSTRVFDPPLLGHQTGWHVVAFKGSGSLLVDLDTGEIGDAPVPSRADGSFGPPAARPDGVFASTGTAIEWWPFPFDESTKVALGSGDFVLAAGAGDTAWIASYNEPGPASPARLVSLVDGRELGAVDLPATSWVVGAVGATLVVGAGGAVHAVEAGAPARLLATGRPVVVIGRYVVVETCGEGFRCRLDAVDVLGGPRIEGVDLDAGLSVVGPAHPDGRIVAAGVEPVFRPVLVGLDGARSLLPEGLRSAPLWGASWSPDGSLLFVPHAGNVVVVDPFAAGGPVEVTRFRVAGLDDGALAVVQPRSED